MLLRINQNDWFICCLAQSLLNLSGRKIISGRQAMRQNLSKGFTLIELMIVVAIIGVLAAVAIPLYQAHVTKSQVARVMSEAGGLRALIETCLNEGTLAIGGGDDECDPGAVGSTLIDGASQTGATLAPNHGVPQVTIGAGGAVTVLATFSSVSVPTITGETLTWSRTIDGAWSCATTIDPVFRIKGCE